jgi:hypothetical protein
LIIGLLGEILCCDLNVDGEEGGMAEACLPIDMLRAFDILAAWIVEVDLEKLHPRYFDAVAITFELLATSLQGVKSFDIDGVLAEAKEVLLKKFVTFLDAIFAKFSKSGFPPHHKSSWAILLARLLTNTDYDKKHEFAELLLSDFTIKSDGNI